MHSAILVMSIMGSTVVVLYFLLRRILAEFFPLKIRLKFLELSILFYLVPFVGMKNYYYDLLRSLTGIDFSLPHTSTIKVNGAWEILSDGTIILPKLSIFAVVISVIYLCVAVIKLIIDYIKYKIKRKAVIEDSKACEASRIFNIIGKEGEENKLLQHLSVRTSDKSDPGTFGIVRPILILPDNEGEDEYEFIIKHELSHIRTNDYATKLMLTAVIILHWFNPLVYLLSAEMKKLLEYQADENATNGFSPERLKEYETAVIELSTEKTPDSSFIISNFGSSDAKIMKERINEMRQKKKFSKRRLIAGAVLLAGIAVLNSFLVFAYHERILHDGYYKPMEGETTIYFDDTPDPYYDELAELDFSGADELLFDEESNVITPIETDEIARASCSHTYVSTTLKEHIKNSSGGCTVNTYSASYCTKCGNITNKSLISSASFTVCPH